MTHKAYSSAAPFVLAALLAVTAPVAAMAAPPPSPSPPPADLSRQGETIQREQQEPIQQDQDRILTSPNPQTVIEVPTHKPAVAAAGSCRTITKIEFTSSPHLPPKQRDKIIAPYIGRCLGLGDVENLLSDITRYYIGLGRPTTRVYIKPQSLREGTLALDIVEGRVEKVVLKDGGVHSINLLTAFGAVDNTTFNLRTFEQGLDQVNRLGSNHATLDILPGSQPGESVVEIKNTPTSPVHLSLSYDNTGQPSTGVNQGSATVIVDDAFGLNDQTSYTRRQTIPNGQPNANSLSDSFLFTVPYNFALFTFGYSDADYKSQTVASGGTVYILTGSTVTTFGRLDAAVWRDNKSKLNLSATITGKVEKNFIDKQFLSVSSRTLSILDLGADFTTVIGDGSLKLGADWSRGLTVFGALRDQGVLTDATPRAQFDKFSANAYLSLPFQIAKLPFSFTSDVEGQYALDPLYSSEQLVVGSPYTVRGFSRGSLVNDSGIFARNDLSIPFPVTLWKNFTIGARPYVGLDAGYVSGVSPTTPSGFLSGVAVGLGLQSGPVSFDVYTSHELARANLPDEGFLTFVRLTVRAWN